MSLVVPAAGCGARAALNGNKILAPIHGRPLLWWTLKRLTERVVLNDEGERGAAPDVRLREIVIAVRNEERETVRSIWNDVNSPLPLQFAAGGATRQESVAAAVQLAEGDLIAVHDAARPLVTAELLTRVALEALVFGAAIPAAPASDTVKKTVQCDGRRLIAETVERETIWLAQTPQIFRREILRSALQQAQAENYSGTDCASLVERLPVATGQQPVAIVAAGIENIKVTYAADLERVAAFLA